MKFACLIITVCVAIGGFSPGGIGRADDGTASKDTPAATADNPAPKTDAPATGAISPSDAKPPKVDAAKDNQTHDAVQQARAELAEAQRMAEEALAAGDSNSETSPSVATPSSDAATASPPVSRTSDVPHHTMEELSSSSLRPDYSDGTHHSMDEFSSPSLRPDYSDGKHHSMDELF
jgi:hypothetical protein